MFLPHHNGNSRLHTFYILSRLPALGFILHFQATSVWTSHISKAQEPHVPSACCMDSRTSEDGRRGQEAEGREEGWAHLETKGTGKCSWIESCLWTQHVTPKESGKRGAAPFHLPHREPDSPGWTLS